MLADAAIHASLAAADVDRARRWYSEKLALEPTKDHGDLLVYRIGDSVFTIYRSAFAGTAKNTVAGWSVPDLHERMTQLRARGVRFEDYEDLGTVDGVATGDDGTLDAWFVDTEGNTIVLGQPPEPKPERIMPILAASDVGRARTWYEDKLGLTPDEVVEGELLVYRSEDVTRFVVYATPSAGTAQNTVAVWRVTGLRDLVPALRARGVVFEDYDVPEAHTVDGILDQDGDLNAWFKDSEGSIIGLADYREALV
jgi:catechol 2,3-dioxygenase-like lactoylglutathione lyase family enzyme